MHSVYFCKKCSIDFPSVSRYVKHRKLFCQLGRGKETYDEGIPEDGIGKLTIAEACKRISRAVELKTKEVDPAVYEVVEQVRLYKKKRRNDGKRINEKRSEVLKNISDLKQELKGIKATFTAKNKKYESIKAYSKVSAIEVTGTEELIDELHDLGNAIVYLEEEITGNIEYLHNIESGKCKSTEQDALPGKPVSVPDKVSSKHGHSREHNTRQREGLQFPALPVRTPVFTPPNLSAPRDMTPALGFKSTELDGRETELVRATSAPRIYSQPALNLPGDGSAVALTERSIKPGSADSTVLLSKLQRKRDIILLQREIRAMQQEDDVVTSDPLSQATLLPYIPEAGVAVYIDYLTPTFHIPANLVLAVIRDSAVKSQTSTFVVTPSTHLTFLGYHEIFADLTASNDVYLYFSIKTMEGEELGWCLFNLFSERTLNSGAWRIPLKSPPFSHDLVSTLYHGVRSLNYSLRLRCAVPAVHEAMLSSPKPKLAQFKLHNPVFTDNLIISNNKNKGQEQKIVRNLSAEKVIETYGPQDDFDPIKVLRRIGTSKSTPFRAMPPPVKTATPPPTPQAPVLTEPQKRIKGLHYHTLILNQPELPPDLCIHTQYCEIDEEFNIKSSSSCLKTSSAHQSALLDHYFLDYQTLELAWNQEEVVLLFCFKDRQDEENVVGWSWALYSDKRMELEVLQPPVPSFSQLVQWLELQESYDTTTDDSEFKKMPNSRFLVRYYDCEELIPRFPDRAEDYHKLPQPRLPTGAFRHVDQKANFTVHDKSRSITLIIDGARHLPSSVTISRVAGRIFDRDFNIVGPQISSSVVLDSDIYNPIYKYSVKIPGNLPNTSIAVLKLYSIHAVTKQLITVGYSLLNLFCKRGTIIAAESGDSSVVLNDGALQLPLYIDGPDAGMPLTMESLKDVYFVPCSYLLIRVMYTAEDGTVPLMPSYNDGVYADNHPNLTTAEVFVLDSYRKRPIKYGKKVCNFDPSPGAVIKKLTRHKGQTVRDISPAEIIEYSPEFGVGVKIVGLKNLSSRESDRTAFVYLRLCTRETVLKFTDHLLCNDSVQFNTSNRIKWSDQIHLFKHVIPSPDIFILIQVLEYSNQQFSWLGWAHLPIFRHTGALTFVNRTSRSEITIIPGSPDPLKLSTPPDIKSGIEAEFAPHLVVELFDARFSSESRTMEYEVDAEYVELAQDGANFITNQMSETRDFT